MRTIRNRSNGLAALWLVLVLAFCVALRRSPFFTGTTPTGSGLESILGAPVWAFLPLTGVALLAAGLTVQWWRGRTRAGESTRPAA